MSTGWAFIDPAEEPAEFGIDIDSPEYSEAHQRYLDSLTDEEV